MIIQKVYQGPLFHWEIRKPLTVSRVQKSKQKTKRTVGCSLIKTTIELGARRSTLNLRINIKDKNCGDVRNSRWHRIGSSNRRWIGMLYQNWDTALGLLWEADQITALSHQKRKEAEDDFFVKFSGSYSPRDFYHLKARRAQLKLKS